MCIVIDANTLSKVFKDSDAQHAEFKPVLDWILDGKGKIVIGGTTLHREIFKEVHWFVRLFRLLRQLDKVVEIDSRVVDAREKLVKAKIEDNDFDDPHIIALVGSSGCKLVCTGDKRSFPFLQNRDLYPKKRSPPAIYQRARNRGLLTDTYIADCCLPCVKLPKAARATLAAKE